MHIHRTAKNKEMQARYEKASTAMNALFYKGLSEAQVDAFEGTLRHVLKNLQEGDKTAKSGPS